MNISPASASAPAIQAELPFATASQLYKKALEAIAFPSGSTVEPRGAVASALVDVNRAVELLTPAATHPDPFVNRAAYHSIHSARVGVAMLQNGLHALDLDETGATPQISFAQFMEIARNSIARAEQALWQE